MIWDLKNEEGNLDFDNNNIRNKNKENNQILNSTEH